MGTEMRAGRAWVRRGPDVVTLCGSMRFFELMLRVAAEETDAGAIVLAPFTVVPAAEQGGQLKGQLDELHRHKIDLSDRVVVVTDESGYWGQSTCGEIAHARQAGIPVTVRRVRGAGSAGVGGGAR